MKSRQTVWVVEDDRSAQFVYKECLDLRYQLESFETLEEFKRVLQTKGERPDIVIADLRLGQESFLDFLAHDATLLSGIPFIVVSSVDDLDALRFCFERGAADYITKPFGKSELIVKVARFLSNQANGTHKSAFFVDPATLEVHHNDKNSPPLTSKEFQILTSLQQAPKFTMSRRNLITRVWQSVHVEGKALDVHLCNLRKKLSGVGVEIAFEPPDCYVLLCHRMDS